MDTIESIPCGGCGHSMQWMYEHSPWGIARFVTCWRCDDASLALDNAFGPRPVRLPRTAEPLVGSASESFR